ncbi:uncharacterized protein BHQ10_004070 [Talaromyces amestolkiae]|uniref:aldehyde dehydrogenase (NAD(+)) n=1 Tax=Talaromyces amestolkiae TaxID=1196081 RepID=A0A364KWY7_TALAM|nr:uncharacterized protein BHQ10_004070 [Talaromyces amestolkiae]RAO68058.1 hypothetical protein BHQ10_004070 [Talaromyces amestolkiae]
MSSLKVHLTAPNGRRIELSTGLFINNEFVYSEKKELITSICPADESIIASVQAASAEDMNKTVAAARAALQDPTWAALDPTDRGHLIYELARLVRENREDLATLESWDNGKPYSVALEEDMMEVIGCLEYYAGFADKMHGQVIPGSPEKLVYTIHEPVGVCGQIIPWNYPLGMAAWKLGPALACGNTVILKPAEQTPLSILYLADLVRRAGFPPGVVNIVNGYGRVAGAALAQHPDVDKIAFTGSTATGREIMKLAAGTLKSITLETGGKSPLIVFDDADLDQAAKWAHLAIMSNQGQICTATSRVIVQHTILDRFLHAILQLIDRETRIGDPFSAETTHGPQVDHSQYHRILSYIESGRAEGAVVQIGGEAYTGSTGKGFYIKPTVFTEVTNDMKIYREEIFGPVLVITSFVTEAEALEMANDTIYGLGGAVFTQNITKAHRVARKIEAGTVWINSSNDSDIRTPFGGYKQSGIGKELGEAGLAAYTKVKAVHVNLGINL